MKKMAMNFVTKRSLLSPALRLPLPAAQTSMALLCNRQLHLHPLQVNRNSGTSILDARSRPIRHEMFILKVSPTAKFLRLVTKCSQANEIELAKKKCVPCESKDLKPMSIEVAEELLQQVPGWNISNEDGKLKLQRAWKVKSFIKGLELFKHVADIAEAEGHHPDLHLVNWNNASIDIWTHSIGGLTENDFILAAKIGSLDVEPFLRKKAAKN